MTTHDLAELAWLADAAIGSEGLGGWWDDATSAAKDLAGKALKETASAGIDRAAKEIRGGDSSSSASSKINLPAPTQKTGEILGMSPMVLAGAAAAVGLALVLVLRKRG